MDSRTRASRMTRADRQGRILDHVLDNGYASVGELEELTGVSVMTVHRDLDNLSSRGLLRRVHGGVSALPTSVFEASSEFRLKRSAREKQALARAAVQFIEPGMSILLDDSTTVFALAGLLHQVGPLTVLCNYVKVFEELRDSEDITFIMLGGNYSSTHESFIGAAAASGVASYAVDIVFQSSTALDGRRIYHPERELVQMKRGMLEAGVRAVLLMDGGKVGKTSLHLFATVEEFDDVVLTDDADPAVVEELRERTNVHLVNVDT